MLLFQTTDHHIKNEEPFFQAGKALNSWIIQQLSKVDEPFMYLNSGDLFHVSKETGRVNGETARFFLELAKLPNCKKILILQGNHDVKANTGSGIDVFQYLSPKIELIKKPLFMQLDDGNYAYFLPHMSPKAVPNYSSKHDYGKEEFHREYWKNVDPAGLNWGELKPLIVFYSGHFGDENAGEYCVDADISFIPGVHSSGHIHKTVSPTHLESAVVTRRDEVDKRCIMRKYNMDDFIQCEHIEIPLFLNYAKIKYGTDLEDYYKDPKHKRAETSLILDIYGHDDDDVVREEYEKLFKNSQNPKVYVGTIAKEERKLEVNMGTCNGEDIEFSESDIKLIFSEFCEQNGVKDSIKEDILKRL